MQIDVNAANHGSYKVFRGSIGAIVYHDPLEPPVGLGENAGKASLAKFLRSPVCRRYDRDFHRLGLTNDNQADPHKTRDSSFLPVAGGDRRS